MIRLDILGCVEAQWSLKVARCQYSFPSVFVRMPSGLVKKSCTDTKVLKCPAQPKPETRIASEDQVDPARVLVHLLGSDSDACLL